MSGGVHSAGHGQQDNLYASPPYAAADGPDLFIRKLLAPVTNGPPPHGDELALSHHEPGLDHHASQNLNTFIKWAGIIFMGILALIGIRKFLGLGKIAEGAVKKAASAVK
jgi:hypothetical protein